VPAVGFVNERKLYKFGEADERINALHLWLDYGFELGNHTFNHSSLTVDCVDSPRSGWPNRCHLRLSAFALTESFSISPNCLSASCMSACFVTSRRNCRICSSASLY
jgi:hypothetical protein